MRRYVFASLLVFALLFSMFSSVASLNTTSEWSIQTLDNYTFKNHGFVAIDSHNNPHIIYYMHDLTNRYTTDVIIEEVRYARWNGTNWDITTVIPEGGVSRDFKLDSNDNPHILYTETVGPQRFITYATWTEENGWVNSRVDGDSGGWGNLALDSTGKPHVAYFMDEEMRYASWTGTSWDIQTVNTPEPLQARLNPPTFFEFDSKDNAHMMYTTESHSIAYIVGDGINWNVSTFFEGYDLVDMALDSTGNPHIVYLESVHPKDKIPLYSRWTGTSWNSQNFQVPANEYGGRYEKAKLALDINDRPHIIYHISTSILMYATSRDTHWDFQTITSEKVEWVGDVTVDSNCDPHVIYYAYQEQPPPDIYGRCLNYATIDLLDVSSAVSDSALPPVTAAVVSGVAIVVVAYLWKKKQ